MTLTGSHHCSEALAVVVEDFMVAWRDFTRKAAWKRIRDWLGIEHWIRATEVTDSLLNGWHPHHHVALLVDRPLGINPDYPEELSEIRQEVDRIWFEVMAKHNRDVHPDVGVDITPVHTQAGLGDYLSKIELEVARGDLKRAKGHSRSPWQIGLEAAHGCKQSKARWAEYVTTMKSRRWYSTSDKLWTTFGINVRTDEEIAHDDSDDLETVALIDADVHRACEKADSLVLTEIRHLVEANASVEVVTEVLTRRLKRQVIYQHRPGDNGIPSITWANKQQRPTAEPTVEGETWRQNRLRRRRELSVKLYRQHVGQEPTSVDQAVAWAEAVVGSRGRLRPTDSTKINDGGK